MTIWEKFKLDACERFCNFETAKGAYMVPAGLIVVFTTIFYLQFVMQVVGVLFGWYIFSEGLRKIFVNRIKQAARDDRLLTNRLRIQRRKQREADTQGAAGNEPVV